MSNKELLTDKYLSLMNAFDKGDNTGGEGSWIALEVDPADYLLSPIIHLIEQNNAKALHVFSYTEEETGLLLILVKIDLKDASAVVRNLRRFEYTVRFSSGPQDVGDETMRNRLSELIYYLEL
jgi:hypothetical protein